MRNSTSEKGGMIPSKTGRIPRQSAVALSKAINDEALAIVRAEIGDTRHAAKRLAEKAGITPRHAKGALLGETGLGIGGWVNLAEEIPALKSYFRRLFGEGRLDPLLQERMRAIRAELAAILDEDEHA
jgi:hypothetical protein